MPAQNILVTGGAGYVGGHAALDMIRAGHRVRLIDTLERGPRETIDRLLSAGAESFIHADCGDVSALGPALEDIDAVMHFAAYARVDESTEHPDRYHENNVEVTGRLVRAAQKAGVRRFIFSSSCAVYGSPDADHLPVREETPLRPDNPYGASKANAETLVRDLARDGSFALGILRYFNVIGSDPERILDDPAVDTRLLSACLRTARGEREQFTIFGTDYDTPDGTAVRDFVHVSDIASAHVALLERLESGADLTFNVGCGRAASVREIIRATEAVTGRPVPVAVGPRRAGDIAAIWADTTRIESELNWTPRFRDLEEMIATSWRS